MSNRDGDSDPEDVELPPPKFQARTFRKRPEGATSTFKFSSDPGANRVARLQRPLLRRDAQRCLFVRGSWWQTKHLG